MFVFVVPLLCALATSGRRVRGGSSQSTRLCAPAIVEETCGLFNAGRSTSTVDRTALETTFAASPTSVVSMWRSLRLPSNSSRVSCAHLCSAVLEFFNTAGTLPPRSDTVCDETRCDSNFSPGSIGRLVLPGNELPDLHDRQFLRFNHVGKRDARTRGRQIVGPLPGRIDSVLTPNSTTGYSRLDATVPLTDIGNLIPYAHGLLELRVSNFFRIYPRWFPDLSTVVDFVTGSNWLLRARKRGVEAQAYVNIVTRRFREPSATQDELRRWFGTSAPRNMHVVREVNRVLNSIAAVLSNVDFVYPGEGCHENVDAYVFPAGAGSTNEHGKLLIYLCDSYMKASKSVQLETLLHEASHHAIAYTEDQCMDQFSADGTRPRYRRMNVRDFKGPVVVGCLCDLGPDEDMVGVTPHKVIMVWDDVVLLEVNPMDPVNCHQVAYTKEHCERLAKLDTIKAVRNADNFCFFIYGVATRV